MANRQVLQAPQEITPWDLKAFLTTLLARAHPVTDGEGVRGCCSSCPAVPVQQRLAAAETPCPRDGQPAHLPSQKSNISIFLLLFCFKYSAEKKAHISF